MTLEDYRQQMDQADEALVRAFCQRMETAACSASTQARRSFPSTPCRTGGTCC